MLAGAAGNATGSIISKTRREIVGMTYLQCTKLSETGVVPVLEYGLEYGDLNPASPKSKSSGNKLLSWC